MASKGVILGFIGGLCIGGLAGGVGGYVINDLTSVENEEVVQQIEETHQTQDELDDLFNDLGSQPPAANASASGSDVAAQDSSTSDDAAAEDSDGSGG